MSVKRMMASVCCFSLLIGLPLAVIAEDAVLMPKELAGTWYAGTVSSVNFFNPGTGQWAAPSGNGLFFNFAADGSYEKGVLMQSSLYNCSMTFFAYNKGKLELSGGQMVLHPEYGRIKSTDTCVSDNNYEKADQLNQETVLWELGTDDYGNSTLYLGNPNGKPSAFHRK